MLGNRGDGHVDIELAQCCGHQFKVPPVQRPKSDLGTILMRHSQSDDGSYTNWNLKGEGRGLVISRKVKFISQET